MKRILFSIIVLLALSSCGANKEKKEEPRKDFADMFELSDYVYIDNSGCLHVAKDCLALSYGDDEEKPNYQVKFIETKHLAPNDFNSMCSKCVSSKSYKELEKIVTFNGASQGYYEETDSAM